MQGQTSNFRTNDNISTHTTPSHELSPCVPKRQHPPSANQLITTAACSVPNYQIVLHLVPKQKATMQNAVVLFKLPYLPSSRLPLHHSPFLSLVITPKKLRKGRRPRETEWSDRSKTSSDIRYRAMPCSAISGGGSDGNGSLRNFKLNESTFLASLMPKKEIGADRFIEAHPNFDGRGVVIAIFGISISSITSISVWKKRKR